MTVDARYRVACSLGTIVSGGVSDNYVQDGYLVSTRGSLTLDGATAPARATEVLIAYEDRGLLVRFPRKLYVLSSHANPYTNRTTVEVGDRIALMEQKREAKAEARADEDPPEWFSTLAEEFQQMLAPTITAQQVLAKCCEAIGVTIASGSYALQSAFLVDRVPLDGGYVSVMRGLLESENCYGFIRPDGQLVVRKIDLAAGSGPVLTVANLESWEPVTGGNLPGDRVTVSYSALQVGQRDAAPDPPETTPEEGSTFLGTFDTGFFVRQNWTREATIGDTTYANVAYQGPNGQAVATWAYNPSSVNISTYATILGQDVVTFREATTTSILAAVNASLCSSYLENGVSPSGGLVTTQLGRTWYTYANDDGNPRVSVEEQVEAMSEVAFAGSLGFDDYVLNGQSFVLSSDLISTSRTVTSYAWNRAGNVTKTTTSRWMAWGLTQEGQQISANAAKDAATVAELAEVLLNAQAWVFDGTEVRISIGRPPTQTRPSLQDLNRDLAAELTGSDLAVISDHEVEVRFDYDNPSVDPLDDGLMAYSIRLPYAPDDYLVGQPKDATQLDVFLVYGGAENLARERAAMENALRFGHANGVSITTEARLMPTEPFAPIYLEAGGISAKFRVNGCSWAFENGTIAAGCDAMLVGVVGRTGGSLFQWVPAVGDINSSPSLGATTISGSPAPAYSAATPGGWNPSSPGGSLGALPTTGTDTYASSRNTTVALPPFVPVVPIAVGGWTGAMVSVMPYNTTPVTVQVVDGATVGASVTYSDLLALSIAGATAGASIGTISVALSSVDVGSTAGALVSTFEVGSTTGALVSILVASIEYGVTTGAGVETPSIGYVAGSTAGVDISPPPWLPSFATGITGVTYSNNNRTVTRTGGSSYKAIVAGASRTTGKWYCEFQIDSNPSGDDLYYGAATTGSSSTYISGYNTSVANDATQQGFTGGVFNSSTSLFNTSSGRIGIAIDFDAKKMWIHKLGAWIGNPAAGTSPFFTWTNVGLALRPAVTFYALNSAYTIPTAWDHTPSGFNAWTD